LSILKKALIDNQIDTNSIFIYDYTFDGLNKLKSNLSTDKENIVFNIADDEAKVSNFLRQMNIETKDFSIMVMALGREWEKYKTLEIDYFSKLKYTSATDYYVNNDKDSSATVFENKFYKTYKRIPNKLGYMGYDIGWYFVNQIYFFGSNFSNCNNQLHVDNISNLYHFKSERPGVFRNVSTNVVQYDNYQKFKKN